MVLWWRDTAIADMHSRVLAVHLIGLHETTLLLSTGLSEISLNSGRELMK